VPRLAYDVRRRPCALARDELSLVATARRSPEVPVARRANSQRQD